MSSEICIFHLELDEQENFVEDEISSSEEDGFLELVTATIKNGSVIVVRFDTDVKNYLTFINNINAMYPTYRKFLQPLLDSIDGNIELYFHLVNNSVFVEVMDGIIVVKDAIISLHKFNDFCYLVKDIVYFMTQ